MTKTELISRLAEANPRLRHEYVERALNTILDEMTAALCRGDRVELRGFGAFTVKRREARTGRNPRTGEPVAVAECYVPAFRMGRGLKDRLNP